MASALALAAGAGLSPQALAQDDCAGADRRPGPGDAAAFEHSVTCLINAERTKADRVPLERDWRLARAAELHATDMVVRDYFSHFSPGGSDAVERLRRVGYVPQRRYWMVGEVLAWGILWRSTPRATVHAWLDSPPHRRAMLEPGFREIGAGAKFGNPVRRDYQGVTVAVELGRVG
ncbi:MAG TPA: CAP domain-containing protein [Solirubrobacteraceae bacterium]